jgi:hypothetical protein
MGRVTRCAAAAALGVLALATRSWAAASEEPVPDAELLLNFDLLKETDLARDRDLYRRLNMFERLRVLEQLRMLDAPPQATGALTAPASSPTSPLPATPPKEARQP